MLSAPAGNFFLPTQIYVRTFYSWVPVCSLPRNVKKKKMPAFWQDAGDPLKTAFTVYPQPPSGVLTTIGGYLSRLHAI